VRYHVYLESEPSLECYRLSHNPRDSYAPVFICPFVVLSDDSGTFYNSMRGLMGQSKNTAMNMGTYKLTDSLDAQCPVLYPYRQNPITESFWIAEDESSVSFLSNSFRFDFGVDSYRWVDGNGRMDITAQRLGQVCTFWIPEQPGYEHPQMLRSHLGKAAGTINGERVEGLFMLDYIYSRPDAMWTEIGMLTKTHNIWMNWLVEYDDGSYEGGYAWRGRAGTDFAAAHHCVNGVSTARSDAHIAPEFTDRGAISALSLSLGEEVQAKLDQSGSTDWPLHTCGTVDWTSRGKLITKSWNFTEFFPTNWSHVADYQAAHYQLFGRPPSFQQLMRGAVVKDETLLFPAGPG
jgi:hypothetical protein